MKKQTETSQFIADKRTRLVYERRHIKRKQHEQYLDEHPEARGIAPPPYRSDVLDYLLNRYTPETKSVAQNTNLRLPRSFSIIDNPSGVVTALHKMVSHSRSERLRSVRIDHSGVESIDLCAESALDFLVKELIAENKRRRKQILVQGHLPVNADIADYVRAVGIVKNLGLRRYYLPEDEEAKRKIMKMRSSKFTDVRGFHKITAPEKAVLDLIKHVNTCLKVHGLGLTELGLQRLGIYAGEILNNIAEHSERNDWCIVGYMDTSRDENICEIAIFNFGLTIADTFVGLPSTNLVLPKIEPYLEMHERKGFFGPTWTRADLLTLVALQGHISSKLTEENPDRGQGTVQLIEFFLRIYDECMTEKTAPPSMALLSGQTHILFDGKYAMSADANGRKVIAFNNDNDLRQPPDPNYIRNIGGLGFPGTAIIIRFPMQPSQLHRVDGAVGGMTENAG